MKLISNIRSIVRGLRLLGERFQRREYEAAKNNRIIGGWKTSNTTADQEVRTDILALRSRARWLEQNDPTGMKYLRECRKNIPGAYGFKLKMKIISRDESGNMSTDKVASNLIEQAWMDWGRKNNCDVTGQNSFRAMQHIIVSHAMRDGEFLARAIRNRSKYGFQIELLEPDIIDETYTAELRNGNVVIMGIELDSQRRRVAYHLKKHDPSVRDMWGYGSKRERVPAGEIYYDFDRTRAFQTRGVTPMSAAMKRMWMIGEYEKASVSHAMAEAKRFGFLIPAEDAGQLTADKVDASTGDKILEVDEASIYEIDKGYTLNMPEPKYPVGEHEPFMKSTLKRVASGLDVSYMNLASDPGDANYSSARIGLLDERETWMMMQEWMIESFLEPLFRDWLQSAFLSSAIAFPADYDEPLLDFDYYDKPYFVGRRWPWVDPSKDADAMIVKRRAGLTSLTRLAAENGDDIEEIFEEIKREEELANALGIQIDLSSGAKPKEESNMPEMEGMPKMPEKE